jgi:hypothetical protein
MNASFNESQVLIVKVLFVSTIHTDSFDNDNDDETFSIDESHHQPLDGSHE